MRWRRRRAQKKACAAVARFRRTCHVCAQGSRASTRTRLGVANALEEKTGTKESICGGSAF